MNFDPVYYHTLTPLTLALKTYAGILFVAAFFWHWAWGSWRAASKNAREGARWWKDALWGVFIYVLCYVPLPDPGAYVGFRDDDVQLQDMQYRETTVAIFMLERISYGVDSLAKTILGWDVSIKALEAQEEQSLDGAFGTVQISRQPNNADIIYGFIVLRGQFIFNYCRNLWHQARLPPPEGEDESTWGIWDAVKALASGQGGDYLVRQAGVLLYSLSSALGLLVAFLVLILISMFVLAVAGAARFAAVFCFGIFLFMLPIAYFIRGRKAVVAGVNLTLVYVLLKGATLIVVWLAFFVLEGVVLQGYLELAAEQGNPLLVDVIDRFEPGFLYTDSGQDILFAAENQARLKDVQFTISRTLIAFIVLLLSMVYIVFKLPAILGSILGVQSLADDLFTSLIYLAAGALTVTKLMPKLAAGGGGGANQLVNQTPSPPAKPAPRH